MGSLKVVNTCWAIEGTTCADGLIKNAFMSMYTLSNPPDNDGENPHRTEVGWTVY